MATNTVIFDQVYNILVAERTSLRLEYDSNLIGHEIREIYFNLDATKKFVFQSSVMYSTSARCTLAVNNRDSDLRVLAREAMHTLTEQ